VDRLENVIARNTRANRNVRERMIVMVVFGGIILGILGLMVFTDLGTPPVPKRAASTTSVTAPAPHDKRIDGVLLRKAPSSPSPSPAPPPSAAGSSSH
jgi:cell division protein FtsN